MCLTVLWISVEKNLQCITIFVRRRIKWALLANLTCYKLYFEGNEWCFSPRGMYVCIARQDFPYRSIETRFRTDRTSQTTSQMIGGLVLSHDLYPPNLFLDQSNACLLHIMSYSIPFETVRISVWRKLLAKWTIIWFLLKQSQQDMENV